MGLAAIYNRVFGCRAAYLQRTSYLNCRYFKLRRVNFCNYSVGLKGHLFTFCHIWKEHVLAREKDEAKFFDRSVLQPNLPGYQHTAPQLIIIRELSVTQASCN